MGHAAGRRSRCSGNVLRSSFSLRDMAENVQSTAAANVRDLHAPVRSSMITAGEAPPFLFTSHPNSSRESFFFTCYTRMQKAGYAHASIDVNEYRGMSECMALANASQSLQSLPLYSLTSIDACA